MSKVGKHKYPEEAVFHLKYLLDKIINEENEVDNVPLIWTVQDTIEYLENQIKKEIDENY